MGVHYRLENNELGLCFECGLVIEDGEVGCVAYTNEGLEILRARGLKQEMLDLFFLAYKLQHHTYFDIKEDEAITILRTIGHYVIQGYYRPMNEQALVDEPTAFMLQSAHSPIFMLQILHATTKKESNAFITQYVTDIWEVYGAFHTALAIATN